MNKLSRSGLSLLVLLAACKTQNAAPPSDSMAVGGAASTVASDLLQDLGTVEKKIIDLAAAMPADRYGWRPDSARSVRQVLLHVAADNYLLPAMLGFAPDPATGITTDYATSLAFEQRNLAKDSVIAELQKSFAFVKQSLQGTNGSMWAGPVTMFGRPFTGQSAWILTVTHLHEHLGQLIAYARTNGVKPPWS